MKKKLNDLFCAQINGRGYEQNDGIHYYESSINLPVARDVIIRIAIILVLMEGWYSQFFDVKGDFLNDDMDDSDKMYMYFPQGFEIYHPRNVVLMILKAVYVTKQTAMQFCKNLVACMKSVFCERNKADSCIYFKWTATGSTLWIFVD